MGLALADLKPSAQPVLRAGGSVTGLGSCMEQQGLTHRDLEPMIGSRGRVSEVLRRWGQVSILLG